MFIFLEAIKQLFPMVHAFWAQQTKVENVQDVINAALSAELMKEEAELQSNVYNVERRVGYCDNCGGHGHYARDCPSPTLEQVTQRFGQFGLGDRGNRGYRRPYGRGRGNGRGGRFQQRGRRGFRGWYPQVNVVTEDDNGNTTPDVNYLFDSDVPKWSIFGAFGGQVLGEDPSSIQIASSLSNTVGSLDYFPRCGVHICC